LSHVLVERRTRSWQQQENAKPAGIFLQQVDGLQQEGFDVLTLGVALKSMALVLKAL